MPVKQVGAGAACIATVSLPETLVDWLPKWQKLYFLVLDILLSNLLKTNLYQKT